MMRDDVVPDLLKEVEENFTSEYGKSEEIKRAFEVLRAKKATYKNANDFAIEVGEVLSRALMGVVRADRLPDGKMYYNIAKRLLEPVLRRNYELVADYSKNVQEHLNELAKISLVAQPADLNKDRIDGFIERFSKEDDFNNVSWLLGEPIVNFSQSVVDDSISKNADFHAKSGLRPKIIRETDKKPCRWCLSLAGVYDYPHVPKDVYRRHQNCRCMVDYDPKNGKVQNVWTKKERVVSSEALHQKRQRVANIYENNRKSDSREYQKIVAVLGRENAPISLAKFQELKYNDGEGYEGLKDRVIWSGATFPSDKSFSGHFETHKNEFIDISKEEYQKAAANLLSKPISDNILGYETETRRVRYDREKNIIAIGKIGKNKIVKITTMFKPDEKEDYYYDDYKRENNHD